jgi:hypothetical protein
MAFMLKTDPILTGAATAAATTVRPIVVVRIKVPDVPVMVTVDVPIAAELLAASVTKTVPGALPALKAAVTPLGRPEAARATLPVNPPEAATLTVLVPAAP